MTALELMHELQQQGIRVVPEDGHLRIGSWGGLNAELRQQIIDHKTELIAILSGSDDQVATTEIFPSSSPVFIDLETRSRAHIELGARRYAADPSTEIMSVVALIDDRVIVWIPSFPSPAPSTFAFQEMAGQLGFQNLHMQCFGGFTLPSPLQDVVTSRRAFCAHNAWDFDRRVWEAKGLPAPSDWLDTLPHARAAGLPGGLDEIGQRLFGMGKSPVGKNLIKKLCRPERNGHFPEPTGDEVSRLVEYNITDVLLLARIYELVQGAGESDVIAVDRAINERGIYFDVAQAEKLLRLEMRVLDDVAARVSEMTVGEITVADLNRIDFLRNWLESLGAALPNLRRETIERFLRDQHAGGERSTIAPVAPAVLAVLQARLMFSKTAMKKLPKAIQAVGADHRLRDQLIYHGGHTGRWTAEGVQVHNLPKAPNELDDLDNLIGCVDDYELFCEAVPDSVAVSDALTALIRPCFRPAPGHILCVADFGSIEARGLAWCAGEELLLQRFAAGEDVYCEFASMLFARRITKENKLDRTVGKIAMLGCGFGMGADHFEQYAHDQNVDLVAAGITARQVVEGYRDAYPKIAGWKVDYGEFSGRQGGMWKDVEDAARDAIKTGKAQEAGRSVFRLLNTTLEVILPSGRTLKYHNAHIGPAIEGDWRARRGQLLVDSPKYRSISTCGGQLTENIVQAICRDLLAASLVRCEAEGLAVVLHVHDELVVEVLTSDAEQALERLLTIMSTPPAWAPGFPLEVEGYISERYVKSPPAGAQVMRARNGLCIS